MAPAGAMDPGAVDSRDSTTVVPGFKYYVHEPYVKKAPTKIKSYGAKFSWSARTRTNTK